MIQLLVSILFSFSSLSFAQTTGSTQKTTTKKTTSTKKAADPAQAPAQTKVVTKPAPVAVEAEAKPAPKVAEKKGGFFVEPYVGYELGLIDATTTASYPPAGNYSFNNNGIALGTRGGYTLSNQVFFALDLQFTFAGQIQVQSQPTGANKPTDNFTKTLLGLQAGWKPLDWFQFWGGYFLLNDLTDQGTSSNRIFHGDGFRLGAGWVISPHVTVGFNYDLLSYKKIDASNTSYNLSNDYSKFNAQVFHFNCSFPFQF